MDSQVTVFFENALAEAGLIRLPPGQTVPPELIPYGQFSLADNTALCGQLCNTVAEQTRAFWTFTEFKRLQNTPQTPPVEPKLDDPTLWPSKSNPLPPELVAKYGPDKTRKLVAAYNLTQARNAYETARQEYQKLQLQIRAIRARYDFDLRGYVAFVLEAVGVDFPAFVQSFFFTPATLYVNEDAREKHTFVTGGTGSGKSETLKTIIRHYLTDNTEPALVVLDPHGDLAEDVARFRENATNDRLVYVCPNRFKGRTVAFNPFDLTARDEVALNRAQAQFLGALQEIIGEDLSRPQKAILTPCLGVLLHMEGATFKDLVRFMDDDNNRDLVRYGLHHLPNEEDREFFRGQFHGRNFESTKEALRYRFNEIVRDPVVREFLCNDSTFDLPACLEAGKLVVFHFDPEHQTKDAIRTVGQLMNAYLVSYAMRRKKGQRRPIHLFADECQYFVSPTISEIMGETRKFGLYATLATQRTDQLGAGLIDAVFGNVGCYLIGRNKNKTAEKMAKEHPLNSDDIRMLEPLEFFQIELDREPVKTKISVIGHKYALTGEAWRDVLLEQGERYYRPDRPAPQYAPESPEAVPYSEAPASLSEANKQRQHQQPSRKPAVPISPFDKPEI